MRNQSQNSETAEAVSSNPEFVTNTNPQWLISSNESSAVSKISLGMFETQCDESQCESSGGVAKKVNAEDNRSLKSDDHASPSYSVWTGLSRVESSVESQNTISGTPPVILRSKPGRWKMDIQTNFEVWNIWMKLKLTMVHHHVCGAKMVN